MEYYWELRSKNAKNITALMCPLYTQALSAILCRECMNACNQKPHWNTTVVLNRGHASPGGREPYCSVYTEQSVYTRASNFFVLVVNVWSPCPCHVVVPAILQSLIVPLCSPRGCCVVLAVSECNTAKCSLAQFARPGKHLSGTLLCLCFRVSLLAFSAPWLSGVLS